MFSSLTRSMCVALFALAFTAVPSAHAGDYFQPPVCHYKVVTSYECKVVYEPRQEAYEKVVVCYDHCGRPYEKTVTCYRTVQVPVKKYVAVTRKVPVYN